MSEVGPPNHKMMLKLIFKQLYRPSSNNISSDKNKTFYKLLKFSAKFKFIYGVDQSNHLA